MYLSRTKLHLRRDEHIAIGRVALSELAIAVRIVIVIVDDNHTVGRFVVVVADVIVVVGKRHDVAPIESLASTQQSI